LFNLNKKISYFFKKLVLDKFHFQM